MIHDLIGESEMDPIVGMLFSMVKENYHRLKSIVGEMSQEEIEYKGPNQGYNSIAQLLKHLAYVDLNWVYRIKGQSIPPKLEEKYGPMINEKGELPHVANCSLETLINQYEEVIEMLKTECYRLTDNELNKLVEYETGKKATIQWGIWHIADHSRYHQAHINQLHKWFSQGER